MTQPLQSLGMFDRKIYAFSLDELLCRIWSMLVKLYDFIINNNNKY